MGNLAVSGAAPDEGANAGGGDGALPAGTMLGRFEILGLLSVGGMAEIYLARSEGIAGFERLAVIKRILPRYAGQAEFVRMFLSEARLGALLQHPNVVTIHDIGEEAGNGNYYYAMEYVRGADLLRIMKAQVPSGPMPLDHAVAIVIGMCAGLGHAHELTDPAGKALGVVHRDVSLSNVLVSYDGTVKVADFGIAKLTSCDDQTRAGVRKGKLSYMSPEQCSGTPLDRRSDIFAIGIILYELSTGKRLFRPEESDFAVFQKIVKGVVAPPSERREDYPQELEAIVMRALQRDRDLRYQTTREMQRDLETFARTMRLRTSATDLADYVRSLVPATVPSFERHQASSRSIRAARSATPTPVAQGTATATPTPVRSATPTLVASASPLSLPPPSDRTPSDRSSSRSLIVVPRASTSHPQVGSRTGTYQVAMRTSGSYQQPGSQTASYQVAGRASSSFAGIAVHTTTAEQAQAAPRSQLGSLGRVTLVAAAAIAVVLVAVLPGSRATQATSAANGARDDRGTAPQFAASVSDVAIDGPLGQVEIQRGVGQATQAFRRCYHDAARAAGQTPAATIRVTFEIGETRSARRIHAAQAPLPGLSACLERAAARIQSRVAPDAGDAQVALTVTFVPADS